MRRSVGLVLVGLGAFCLALAPLVRFYVAEQIVIAPRNLYLSTTLEATGATYFDTALVKLRTGRTLQATNIVRADVRAGSETVAVWDSSTVVRDKDLDKQIDIQDFRIALDRRSSQLINCCGVKVGEDTRVKMSGYGIIFPVGDVGKQDYSFFDATTKRSWPMRYEAEEPVRGLTTYRFVQNIPSTKIAHLGGLSGTVLGLPKQRGLVKADRYWSATITFWVDPRTGVPVKQQEQIRNTIRSVDGEASMDAGSADLVTTEASQKSLRALSDDYAFKINGFRVLVPAASLIAGLLLTLIGGAMGLIGSGGDRRGSRSGGTQRPPAGSAASGASGASGASAGTSARRAPAGSAGGTVDAAGRWRPPAGSPPAPVPQARPSKRPQGTGKPRPDGSGKPRPEGAGKPRPESAGKPRPEGAAKPRPDGTAKPRPEAARAGAARRPAPAAGRGQGAARPGRPGSGSGRS